VNDKATAAAHDFEGMVWPVLARLMVGSRLQSVETEHGFLATDLDCTAGIDAYVKTPLGLETFAVRVQWRDYRGRSAPWARGKCPMTFTVRTMTEMPKRLDAHHDGRLGPYWTLQGYLASLGGPLEAVAWTRTAELYEFVEYERETGFDKIKVNGEDGTRFVAIPWTAMSGYRWFRAAPRQAKQTSLFPVRA
jgi:hypothetical protein